MNRLSYIAIGVAIFASSLFIACEDNRLDGILEDGVCFLEPAWQQRQVINEGKPYSIKITISKGGIGKSVAEFKVVANEEILNRYNDVNETDYRMLPTDCYTIVDSNLTIPASGLTASVEVVFDLQKITDRQGAGNINLTLPLQIVSNNGISIGTENGWAIYAFQIENATIGFKETDWTSEQTLSMEGSGWTNVTTDVVLNYSPEIDMTYTIIRNTDIDIEYIQNYNAQYGTTYRLIPDDGYAFVDLLGNIKKDSTSGLFSIAINRDKLTDIYGNPAFGKYVLPLKITDASLHLVSRTNHTQLLVIDYNLVMFDRTDWKILEWNSDLTMDPLYAGWITPGINNRTATAMLESSPSTRWQSKIGDVPPFYFIFDMAEQKKIQQIRLLFPIGSDDWRGNPKNGYFETSNTNNGTDWAILSNWERTVDADRINAFSVPITTARYLKFTINEVFANTANTSIMEFQVWGTVSNE